MMLPDADAMLRKVEREALARAWDEGAKWAAVEFSGDDRYEIGAAFLAPGDNPYREKPKPEASTITRSTHAPNRPIERGD